MLSSQLHVHADSLQRRGLTGRQKHRVWEPQLDPPALLWDVTVVLVSPKRPSSVGAVARACGSFECEDLRLVRPRCDRLMRSARNGAKGSQYLLWRATEHDDLAHALAGVDHSVAFTRWVAGMPAVYDSPGALLASPALAPSFAPRAAGAAGGRKLALVFGREERGLDAEEVAACDAACSIPIGRLQESLSLSHAVSLALAPLFEARLRQRGSAPLVASAADLAVGPPPGDGE
jgi:tRNA C32,U32 (ribose-2'-O)-methylase TrmJ